MINFSEINKCGSRQNDISFVTKLCRN